MPKLVYTPDSGDRHEWDLDLGKLLSPERIAIEKLTGMTWGEWKQALAKDSVIATHALLYVLLKRANPTLTPDGVSFAEDEIDFAVTDDEARAMLDHFKESPDDSPEVTLLLAKLRAQVGDDPAPKAKPKAKSKR